MKQKTPANRAVLIVLICIIAGMTAAPVARPADNTGAQKGSSRTEPRVLAGKWLRPDGGYVLELRDISKSGRLKAAYFNPRPINVHQASWSGAGGRLTVFVELRDINYPGSKYTLQYDPTSGRLKGTYFQAVERQTYDIEFVRLK